MKTLVRWLGGQRWAAFLLFQCSILAIASTVLAGGRYFTGRSIHFGQDPHGFVDAVLVAILSIGVVFLTRSLYSLVRSECSPDLGITPSLTGMLHLLF